MALQAYATHSAQSHIPTIIQKRDQERAELKEKMAALARESGFDLRELMGGGRGRKGMMVSVKYRDPENPENTWTGRGRMPRWMVAAMKSPHAERLPGTTPLRAGRSHR